MTINTKFNLGESAYVVIDGKVKNYAYHQYNDILG